MRKNKKKETKFNNIKQNNNIEMSPRNIGSRSNVYEGATRLY